MEEIKLTKLANCAGCGAKVGAAMLSQVLKGLKTNFDDRLIVGYDKSDDACVYKVSDELALVQTLDFFPPIVDDPYTFGRIAATNALSDIYAMGAEPKLALNIMCVPESMDKKHVQEILRGGYDTVYEAGAIIAGGHSIFDDEPKYGLSVTGFVHPEKVLRNDGAEEGDVLFLTKPLGVGILSSAEKAGLLSDSGRELLVKLMTTLNRSARDVMIKYSVHACTDVTGFSFLGHLCEMAEGSALSAYIDVNGIDIVNEALGFAQMGLLPKGMYRNRAFAESRCDLGNISEDICDVLFDPQTSGGLLIACAPEDADRMFIELKDKVISAQRVGVMKKRSDKAVYLMQAEK